MSTSPGRLKTRVVRPNLTKVHLIYFALASFDLAAIGGGLWLSEYTKSNFEDSVHSFQLGDLLRDNMAAVLEKAIAISAPANEVFETGDIGKARSDLVLASAQFDEAMAKDHYGDETKAMLDKAVTKNSGALPDRHEHGGLALWFPKVAERYEALEADVNAAKTLQVREALAAIESLESGDREAAGGHMSKSDAAGREILGKMEKWLELSDEISDRTVTGAVAAFNLSTFLQYLIGGGILLMVTMVLAYGHFVGKLLRRKFDELEVAHASSNAFAGELQQVNDDVTRLNVELAANMKKLTEAQDEMLRRGKMAQLGQLTATVAHELRNPLGSVRTSAFLLERKIRDKGLGVEPQIERIANGVSRCDNIITQLLDFARSRSLQMESVDFDEWLEKIVNEEAQKLPEAVGIVFEPGLAGRIVTFDPARMSRVIINLMSNASEAMVGKGDDPKKFTTSSPIITIATRPAGRGVELEIKDTGPGISAENLQKILEPLFTTKNFGTGLGLPAVEKILQEHGGGIEVESKPGEGASFTAWFPGQELAQEAA